MKIKLIWLAIGLLFVGVGVFLIMRGNTLEKNCTASTEATVYDYRESFDTDSDGASSTYYYAKIKYSVDGKTYDKENSTGLTHKKYKEGSKVTVMYNPKKPDELYIKGESLSNGLMAYILIGLGALVAIVGLFAKSPTGGLGEPTAA